MVNNMNNLIITNEEKLINDLENITIQEFEGAYVIDSREIAKLIGKRHAHLLVSIGNYIQVLENGRFRSRNFFIKHTYLSSQGVQKPCYLVTEKGCEMIFNKMTGDKGILFTGAFVEKFHAMKQQLKATQELLLNEKIKELTEGNEEIKIVVDELQEKINLVINTERISFHQELELTELVNFVVTCELGGKDSVNYINNAKKTFPKVWKAVKKIAGVSRKGDIPKNKYDDVIDFVNNWSLSSVPKNQMKLDI